MLDSERIEVIMYYLRKTSSIEILDETELHNAVALALNDVIWTDGMSRQTAIDVFKEKHETLIERLKSVWYRLT